jgi:hypothetical protein
MGPSLASAAAGEMAARRRSAAANVKTNALFSIFSLLRPPLVLMFSNYVIIIALSSNLMFKIIMPSASFSPCRGSGEIHVILGHKLLNISS